MNHIIKQIIPADSGHRAVFIEGKATAIEPVICWALCEALDDEDDSASRTFIVPVVAYPDPFIQQLRVITDDVYDFWCMLKPGEEPPSEEEVRKEVADRQSDLDLRRFKTRLLFELFSQPMSKLVSANSHGWIYRMQERAKEAAEHDSKFAEKYEAYQERVRKYSEDSGKDGHEGSLAEGRDG